MFTKKTSTQKFKPFEKKDFNYNEKQLFRYGINKLSAREYSKYDLKNKMLRLQKDVEIVDKVLETLVEKGYLSDERKARNIILQYSNKEGISKTTNRLRQRGISNEVVERVKEEIDIKEDEFEIAYQIIYKKYKLYNPDNYQKMTRLLASKGFSFDSIRKALDKFKSNID